MGTRRQRRGGGGGGVRRWASMRQQILEHLKEDRGRFVTTMVDYYRMPRDWPGRASPFTAAMSVSDRAKEIENALLQDVSNEMGTGFNPNRFVPYVMMHEFEAMLFSDCDSFGRAIGRPDLIDDFSGDSGRLHQPGRNRRFPNECSVQAYRESDARVSETNDGSSGGAEYRSGSDPPGSVRISPLGWSALSICLDQISRQPSPRLQPARLRRKHLSGSAPPRRQVVRRTLSPRRQEKAARRKTCSLTTAPPLPLGDGKKD